MVFTTTSFLLLLFFTLFTILFSIFPFSHTVTREKREEKNPQAAHFNSDNSTPVVNEK